MYICILYIIREKNVISQHIYIVQCLRKIKSASAKHCCLFMVNIHILKLMITTTLLHTACWMLNTVLSKTFFGLLGYGINGWQWMVLSVLTSNHTENSY